MASRIGLMTRGLLIVAATVWAGCGGGGSTTSDLPCSQRDGGCELPGDTVQPPADLLDSTGTDTTDIGRDTGTDTGNQPGGFGSPCSENKDCIEGFCVEGVDGLVCTRPCVSECPDDWVCRAVLIGGDLLSLCIPSGVFLCRQCTRNSQCADGLCVTVGDGQYCTKQCSDLQRCPVNYECRQVTDPETSQQSNQCLPANGSCSCRVTNDKEQRTCAVENDFGTCLGFETCDAATGWGACSAQPPASEVCDGIDNDCNRVTDDNPAVPEGDCYNEVPDVGSCKGSRICRGEAGWDCVGPIPQVESCNYLDDDCDGLADEDFKDESGRYVAMENCGQCGQSCDGLVPFAKTVVCDTTKAVPACKVTECEPGYSKVNDLLCAPAISSLCVPCVEDSNCGTQSDKCLDYGTGRFCGRDCSVTGPYGTECPQGYGCSDRGGGVFQCMPVSGTCECTSANEGIRRVCERTNTFGTCSGTEVCDGSLGWIGCSARTASAEICDGLDNDCNGLVDDALAEPSEPCEKAWTDPSSGTEYICSGTWQCTDTAVGREWVCPARMPGPEVCNYIDDNCDGRIDETFKLAGTGKYNDIANCGACNVSCAGMVPHATMMCEAAGPQPVCLVDKCDPGWWKASDLSCTQFPNSLCMACAADSSCQVPGDKCAPADSVGNSYCLWDCSDEALRPVVDPVRKTCPEGYYCRETNDQGQPFFKCFPDSGACDCIEGREGQVRACAVSNASGRCFGQQTCDPAHGWSVCDARTPTVEKCNRQDDDCNGLVDETFPQFGSACSAGLGECQRPGTVVCNATGTGTECNAVAGQSGNEICDRKDNDCDGQIDESFTDLGKVCSVGRGECLATGVYDCNVAKTGLVCSATEGTPSAEKCDDRDNDCDGDIDEEFAAKGRVCSVGIGECQANGVWICSADKLTVVCNGEEGVIGDEECDGRDNDCDLEIDEPWPEKGTVCTVGLGACRKTGTYRCMADRSGIECSVTAGSAVTEKCDNVDNDCDGETDEAWATKGLPCTAGVGQCRQTGVYRCRGDQLDVECSVVAGPSSAEQCDGLDNDCDGQVDEDWTTLGRACQTGVGECAATGVWVCNSGRTGVECDAVPGTPVAEKCDGRDNDCDGDIDETFTDLNRACTAGTGDCLDNGVYRCLTNGTGTYCDAVAGTPVAEKCDGRDNDCDGQIDETFTDLNRACQAGQGDCLATGVNRCLGNGSGTYCDVVPGTPTTEKCDGRDNDCDGDIDETWPTKGSVCYDGVGECRRAGVNVCNVGGTALVCDVVTGTAVAELCDGLDNDCDGQTDETFTGKGAVCFDGIGECRRSGTQVCKADKTGLYCTATAASAQAETCDGLDNDCDGAVDEAFANLNLACTAGIGDCLNNGVFRCLTNGTGTYCDAVAGTPVAETCDGRDNDCDGQIDETFTDLNRACQAGQGECLANGVNRCLGSGTGTYCDAVPGTPIAERCDSRDNDCDGSVDETWPTKGSVCYDGTGECRRAGVNVCNAGGTALVCDVVLGSPTAETCDGLDNDCDGQIDETFTDKGAVCFDGIGECRRSGTQVCKADKTGLYCTAVAASAQAESCDGLDNDCDGATDEVWTDKGTVCSTGQGQCASTGTWVCNTGHNGLTCNAVAGTPGTESCDYLDNDCDGQTDETFKTGSLYTTHEACGNCYTNCVNIYDLPNAFGVCDTTGTPVCRMQCDPGYYDLNQIPDDGCEFNLDITAVYVSADDPMAADDGSCGLAPSAIGLGGYPCRSIGQGISRSVTLGRSKVLVANGVYVESVSLPNSGRSILGGYRSDTWERDVATTLTTIRGVSGTGHVAAVTADGVSTATIFEGFIVQAPNATGTSKNSYGIYVLNSTSALQIRSNIVYAGAGGPGTTGGHGTSGPAGLDGAQGQATRNLNTSSGTCWGDPAAGYLGNIGGAGGERTCSSEGGGNTVVNGGKGGFTSCPDRGRQEGSQTGGGGPNGGLAGSGPTPGAGGPGGWGSDTTTGWTCYPTNGEVMTGTNGGDGADGNNGTGGAGSTDQSGTVGATNHWSGTAGTAGTAGTHGSGGGGGGGGGGQDLASTNRDDFGGGGGGGGSGGCGGYRGVEGAAGGGSFGIFVSFSGAGPSNATQMPVITGNIVTRGLGGSGGAGGNGGTGGGGGAGGAGGPIDGHDGPLYCIYPGARGGNGGRGGHAGGGGGGSGGVSWDIFVYNKNAVTVTYGTTNTFRIPNSTATGGAGGAGGLSSNTSGGSGGAGVAGESGNFKAVP